MNINEEPISKIINRKISIRIFFVFILLVSFLIINSIWDLNNLLLQKEKSLKNITDDLETYIISQYLIKNRYAIDEKVKETQKENQFLMIFQKNHNGITDRVFYTPPFKWTYYHKIKSLDEMDFGFIKINGTILSEEAFIHDFLYRMLVLIVYLIGFIFLIKPLYKKIPYDLIIYPIEKLLNTISPNANTESKRKSTLNDSLEINKLNNKIIDLVQKEKELSEKETKLKVAKQVYHDIRSPVLALETLLNLSPEIDDERKKLFNQSIRRVSEIINDLAPNHSFSKKDNYGSKLKSVNYTLAQIIKEKHLEYPHHKIVLNQSNQLHCLTIKMNEHSFFRVVSNLINNSAEASSKKSFIKVFYFFYDHKVYFVIRDYGKGIKPNHLSKIFNEGFSTKPTGSDINDDFCGLGLSYANKKIVESGGKIWVKSKLHLGTKIIFSVPGFTTQTN